MKFSARARALAVVAASASMVAVPLALPASSAVAQPGSCTKLTTKTVNKVLTATLTGCTPTAATGGKGSGTFKSQTGTSGKLTITITWTKTGTTKGSISFKTSTTSLGKCPKPATVSRITITGKVTGGTGTAFKTIKTGQPINGSVCDSKAGVLTLEPGTSLKF